MDSPWPHLASPTLSGVSLQGVVNQIRARQKAKNLSDEEQEDSGCKHPRNPTVCLLSFSVMQQLYHLATDNIFLGAAKNMHNLLDAPINYLFVGG